MRLKHVFISEYKNLKDFSLDFDNDSFIDFFVGKNGSGKSNLLEALVEIFHHILAFSDNDRPDMFYDYKVIYEIGGKEVTISWKNQKLFINNGTRERKSFGQTPIPDNLLIYYSGHNQTISNIVNVYEERFRNKIKKASLDDARELISIGPKYKELLLAVILVQPENCRARNYLMKSLGIDQLGFKITSTGDDGKPVYSYTGPILKIKLKRPIYAQGNIKFDIENQDLENRYWKPEGRTKTFLDKLHASITTDPGGITVTSGYQSEFDSYILYIDIEYLRAQLPDYSTLDLFHAFDGLKTIGMLDSLEVPLALKGDVEASISYFSDGQFQSVYIYAVTELFKGKDCITLLDEPDAFLHPEWQFKFLGQVLDISEQAAKSNHILISSHSASTITTVEDEMINLFDIDDKRVVLNKVKKSDVIKSLSAGLISFTEGEARLNIQHVLKNTSGPVLFTEGITDEMILEMAWDKLFPGKTRPFEIQGAFDRRFLKNLFKRDDLRNNYPRRVMVALFDFDIAYDDWKELKAEEGAELVETDPLRGLCKQLQYQHHYATLLPVPDNESIKPQVLDAEGKPWGRGLDSYLSIEILFYKDEWLGEWFRNRAMPGGGEIIEFTGDKVRFANEVVPTIDPQNFEIFRPMFEFVKSKCAPEEIVEQAG